MASLSLCVCHSTPGISGILLRHSAVREVLLCSLHPLVSELPLQLWEEGSQGALFNSRFLDTPAFQYLPPLARNPCAFSHVLWLPQSFTIMVIFL